MRADGSDVRRLTNNAADDGSPMWSPDGSVIAFVSGRDDNRDIYLVRPDGGRLERVTVGGRVTNDMPHWSPDGSRLAVQTARGGNYNIELVRIAGQERVPLAATPAFDGQFSWSPDGARLAFISARDGFEAVYVSDADGARPRRLTASRSLNPAWSP